MPNAVTGPSHESGEKLRGEHPHPRTMQMAMRLIDALIVILIVGPILTLIDANNMIRYTKDVLFARSLKTGHDEMFTDANIGGVATTVFFIAAIVLPLIAIVTLFLLRKRIGRGSRRARVVATVLGIVMLAIYIAQISDTASQMAVSVLSAITTVLTIISGVIVAVIIILMWVPDSNAWFRVREIAHREHDAA